MALLIFFILSGGLFFFFLGSILLSPDGSKKKGTPTHHAETCLNTGWNSSSNPCGVGFRKTKRRFRLQPITGLASGKDYAPLQRMTSMIRRPDALSEIHVITWKKGIHANLPFMKIYSLIVLFN